MSNKMSEINSKIYKLKSFIDQDVNMKVTTTRKDSGAIHKEWIRKYDFDGITEYGAGLKCTIMALTNTGWDNLLATHSITATIEFITKDKEHEIIAINF